VAFALIAGAVIIRSGQRWMSKYENWRRLSPCGCTRDDLCVDYSSDPHGDGNELADSGTPVPEPFGSSAYPNPLGVHHLSVRKQSATTRDSVASKPVSRCTDPGGLLDTIDLASFDSFPASDAPAWWAR
jgi:hypothetical protein